MDRDYNILIFRHGTLRRVIYGVSRARAEDVCTRGMQKHHGTVYRPIFRVPYTMASVFYECGMVGCLSVPIKVY